MNENRNNMTFEAINSNEPVFKPMEPVRYNELVNSNGNNNQVQTMPIVNEAFSTSPSNQTVNNYNTLVNPQPVNNYTAQVNPQPMNSYATPVNQSPVNNYAMPIREQLSNNYQQQINQFQTPFVNNQNDVSNNNTLIPSMPVENSQVDNTTTNNIFGQPISYDNSYNEPIHQTIEAKPIQPVGINNQQDTFNKQQPEINNQVNETSNMYVTTGRVETNTQKYGRTPEEIKEQENQQSNKGSLMALIIIAAILFVFIIFLPQISDLVVKIVSAIKK